MPTSRSALRRASPKHSGGGADLVLETHGATLLDVVDNALTKGVVLRGDVTLGLADVDLIDGSFSLVLCASDRLWPTTRVPRRRRRG